MIEPSSPPPIVGRAVELALIGDFLDRAARDGGALVLSGEPGVGKTALLAVAAERAAAAGTRVVRAEGVEFEAADVFSGLSQILLPLAGGLDRLIPAQRDALAVLLGLAEGGPADQAQVARAALNLVRAGGTDRPLLLVVDDLQWVDRYSGEVLSFVARRLAGSRTGFLAGGRSGGPDDSDLASLPHHGLGTLADDAANDLLRARFPALAPRVRRRLLDEARGNPLALLELPPALSGRQHAIWQSLPAVLPLTDRLQALFAARVTAMPEPTRDLLLLAALYGVGDFGVLDRATGGHLLDHLAPAEQADLVRADDAARQLVFRHPLTRSAVVGLSTAQQRQHAHRRLADAVGDQPDRRAGHLAAATVAPDEEVAALLAESARRIARRGDPVAGAAALTRAADLTPDPAERGRRLAEAAFISGTMSWQPGTVPSLLAQARETPLDTEAELHAAAAAAYISLNGDDDIESAHRLLVSALDAYGGDFDAGNDAHMAAIGTFFQVCLWDAREEMWAPYLAALSRVTPAVPRPIALLNDAFRDAARVPPEVLRYLDEAIAKLPGETDPDEIGLITSAAAFVDRLPACRNALRRLIRGEEHGGAVLQAIGGRGNLALDAFMSGRWDEGDELVRDGFESCRANNHTLFERNFQLHGGLLAAVRGDHDRAAALADGLDQWGIRRQAGLARIWAAFIRTVDAHGRADFTEAYRHATAISPAGTFPANTAIALLICLELVDSAMRTGRAAEAAAHVDAMRALNLPAISPRLDFVTRSCAALAGDDLELFAAALDRADLSRWPFDAARVQLAYGERLRRAHAATAARVQLAAAHETLERLGAAPWAARAEAELRASGRTDASDRPGLTAQEYEIAALAAAGLTNRQIGERLYLSHRTVSTHLYRIFPKLGITTRAALRDALSAVDGPAAG